jgi:hypothetical protein
MLLMDGLAGIFRRTDRLWIKSVGHERACRRTVPVAESAAEKVAVAEDAESAVDGIERADAAEDGAQSFARVVGSCWGYLIRARQRRYLKCADVDVDVGAENAGNANDADDASEVTIVDTVNM